MTGRPGGRESLWWVMGLGPALVAGAVVRLLLLQSPAAAALHRAPLLDAAAYDAWARRIASGFDTGSGVFFLAPLYPHLLGALYALGGDGAWHAVVLQHVLVLALVALCGVLAWRWGGPVAGGATAWLLALNGALLVYAHLLLAEILGACLLTAAVLAVIASAAAVGSPAPLDGRSLIDSAPAAPARRERRSVLLALVGGLAFGLAALVRPTNLVVGLLLAGVLGWRQRHHRGLLAGSALLLGMAIAVLPVTVRNRVVGGEWVLVTSSGGYNLYVGNHRQADGTYVQPAGVRFVPGDAGDPSGSRLAERETGRAMTAGQVSRYWLERTWSDVWADPGRAVRLYLRKVALFWNRFEVPQIVDLRELARDLPLLGAWLKVSALLPPLALFGLWAAFPRQPARPLLVAALVGFGLVTALVFVTARYRVQILPLEAILAGGAVARLVAIVRDGAAPGRRRVTAAWGAGVVACLVLTSPVMLGLGTASGQPWIPAMHRALRLAEAGADSSRVLAAFREAESLGPSVARIHANRGSYRLDLGDADGAVRDFETARRLDAGDPVAATGLGRAHLARGEIGAARAALAQALAAEPDYSPALLAMAQTLVEAGEIEAAIRSARRALAVEASAGAHALLGMLLVRQGETAERTEGLEHLERAVMLAPAVASHRYNLGLAQLEVGDIDGGVRTLEQLLDRFPGHAGATLALAAVHMERGETDAARRLLEAALATSPVDPRLGRALEQIESAAEHSPTPR